MSNTTTRIYELQVKLAQESLASLKKLQANAAGVESKMDGAASALKSFASGFAGAFSVGAVVTFVKATIDAADRINDLSQSLGVGAEQLGAWELAANQSGTSLEGIAKGVKALSSYMVSNKGDMQALGITATDTNGALLQLADLFADMPDGIEKTALASKILGKAGIELIPLLSQGSKGLEESRLKAEAYAKQLAILAPQADKFNDEMSELALQTKAAGMNITGYFLPGLTGMAKFFNDLAAGGERSETALEFMGENSSLMKGMLMFRDFMRDLNKGGASNTAKVDFSNPFEVAAQKSAEYLALQKRILAEREALRKANAVLAKEEADALAKKIAGERERMIQVGEKNLASQIDSEEEMRIAVEKRAAAEAQQAHNRLKQLEDLAAARQEELRYLSDSEEVVRETMAQREKDSAKVKTDLQGMDKLMEQLASNTDGYAKDLAGLMVNFAFSTDDASKSFEDFTMGVLRNLAQMATQIMIMEPLMRTMREAMTGTGGSGGAGGFLGFIKDAIFNAKGGVYNSPSLSAYSNQVHTSPKMFAFAKGAGIFAEDGAEAIMPLKRGADGTLGVEASGSGSGDMIVVINNESRAEVTPGKESTGVDGKRMIEIWVRDAVTKGFASGSFDGIMGSTYGLNRRGAF